MVHVYVWGRKSPLHVIFAHLIDEERFGFANGAFIVHVRAAKYTGKND